MPVMEMYADHLLMDSVIIEYEEMISTDERQQHQEKIALEMCEKHRGKIMFHKIIPVFYITEKSKLNDKFFQIDESEIENIINQKNQNDAERKLPEL